VAVPVHIDHHPPLSQRSLETGASRLDPAIPKVNCSLAAERADVGGEKNGFLFFDALEPGLKLLFEISLTAERITCPNLLLIAQGRD
jgi:hypothetical protein